nr:MAG TPA: hypothetical protein [Caudoviricetes sp.]
MQTYCVTLPDKITVALLVIGGYYGNGEDRKEKLKKDGFDYKEIQSFVNELIPIVNKAGG